MTNPTERPEERDSLSETERKYVDAVEARPDLYRAEQDVLRLVADIRTLLNEVRELREEKKLATQQTVDAINRKVTVENDLKEREERIAEVEHSLADVRELRLNQFKRIKQMEEALREKDAALVEAAIPLEALYAVESGNPTLAPTTTEGIRHALAVIRAALPEENASARSKLICWDCCRRLFVSEEREIPRGKRPVTAPTVIVCPRCARRAALSPSDTEEKA